MFACRGDTAGAMRLFGIIVLSHSCLGRLWKTAIPSLLGNRLSQSVLAPATTGVLSDSSGVYGVATEKCWFHLIPGLFPTFAYRI